MSTFRESVGVVIPNWNGREHLLSCLESLTRGTLLPQVVVVVDNNSLDDSPDAVAKAFPATVVIRNEQNLGFARASNQGGAAAVSHGCNFVLFLNNDTVLAPTALELMVSAALDPRVALVNPLITDFDDNVWFSGARFCKLTGEVKHDHTWVEPTRGLVDIASATGCAMLARGDVVRTFGPFDERYFAYYEDSDLSATLLRNGERIVLQPAAIVKHRPHTDGTRNAPRGFHYYLGTRNRMLFARSHLGAVEWGLFLIGFTSTFVIPRALALFATGRSSKARGILQGYVDYFRKRFGAPRL